MTSWTVQPVAVDSPLATALVHDYLIDIIGRYYGRPATRAEVDRALVEDPTDDLVAFYVGRHRGQAAGCAGFRLVDPGTAELKRLYVAAGARGTGGGAALLAAVERGAAALGARRVRLDTRADLVEARALYAGHGYAEVAPFNADPYAGYWFEKRL